MKEAAVPSLKQKDSRMLKKKPGLKRAEVARALGIGKTTLRRWEARGEISCRGARGEERRFDPSAVADVLRRRRPEENAVLSVGEEAAAVFRLLEEDVPLREIVISLRVSPERVRELYAAWAGDLSEAKAKGPLPTLEPMTEEDLERHRRRLEHALEGRLDDCGQ